MHIGALRLSHDLLIKLRLTRRKKPTDLNMELFSIADYEEKARDVLIPGAKIYFDYAVERGWGFQDSKVAFSRYRIRSRVLQDVSKRSLSTTVLGEPITFPIGIAPTALHGLAHPAAEKETARGAAAAGALMILSANSTEKIADVAAAAPGGLRWMQVYPFNDRLLTQHMIREAEKSGFKAIVVTVDSPSRGLSTSLDKHFNSLNEKGQLCFRNFDVDIPSARAAKERYEDDVLMIRYLREMQFNPTVTQEYIRWIKSITSLPLVCKGILTGESAILAANAGADGILVSAHGGRQLEGVPAPIDALAEVVDAVRGRGVEVYMDGGVRTGTDVFKALGRGARAVFVGRPILWGLACQGGDGVRNVLNILKNELDLALAVSGSGSPNNIAEDAVVHESYYWDPIHIVKSKL